MDISKQNVKKDFLTTYVEVKNVKRSFFNVYIRSKLKKLHKKLRKIMPLVRIPVKKGKNPIIPIFLLINKF